MTESKPQDWARILAAGVRAQRLVPGAIAVGGTAAALYAHHRVSNDTDHLVANLRDDFERVRETLEQAADWKTARVQPPVLILGSVDGVQVGFRQSRRVDRIETVQIQTPSGPLTVPTIDEMIGMKAYLAYARNATRDFLDFAALTTCVADHIVLEALLKSDQRYGHLQQTSVALQVAKTLTDPRPYDLNDLDLTIYKGLADAWQSWEKVRGVCRSHGERFARRLILDDQTS